jgi:hypothetical protein
MYVCMLALVCMHLCLFVSMFTYVCKHVRMYCVGMHVCTYVSIYVCMYVCMYATRILKNWSNWLILQLMFLLHVKGEAGSMKSLFTSHKTYNLSCDKLLPCRSNLKRLKPELTLSYWVKLISSILYWRHRGELLKIKKKE